MKTTVIFGCQQVSPSQLAEIGIGEHSWHGVVVFTARLNTVVMSALIQTAAESETPHLVVCTNDQSLTALVMWSVAEAFPNVEFRHIERLKRVVSFDLPTPNTATGVYLDQLMEVSGAARRYDVSNGTLSIKIDGEWQDCTLVDVNSDIIEPGTVSVGGFLQPAIANVSIDVDKDIAEHQQKVARLRQALNDKVRSATPYINYNNLTRH